MLNYLVHMKEDKKKFNPFDFAIKYQKYIILSAVLFSALMLVYALIYATPFAGLMLYADPSPAGAALYVRGAEVFYHIQDFNQSLFVCSLFLIVLTIVLYVFFCQKRRIYYITNYIAIATYSAFLIFTSVFAIINILKYKAEYLSMDFERLEFVSVVMIGIKFEPSTVLMDIGVALAILAIIGSLCILFLAVSKFLARKKELKQIALKTAQEGSNG